MNTNCEVISAFIDDEPFDTENLANALATPEGRNFLIDAIVLRRLTRSTDHKAVASTSKSNIGRRLTLAAAVLLAAVASFEMGHRHGLNATMRAPEPTRVISAGPAWQEDSHRGGVR
jgi:hypothetical protein